MDLVIGNNNWALDIYRVAPTSLLKEEFSEERILSKQECLMDWDVKRIVELDAVAQPSTNVSNVSSTILKPRPKTYKSILVIWRLRTLHQISLFSLLEFWQSHSAQPVYKLKV